MSTWFLLADSNPQTSTSSLSCLNRKKLEWMIEIEVEHLFPHGNFPDMIETNCLAWKSITDPVQALSQPSSEWNIRKQWGHHFHPVARSEAAHFTNTRGCEWRDSRTAIRVWSRVPLDLTIVAASIIVRHRPIEKMFSQPNFESSGQREIDFPQLISRNVIEEHPIKEVIPSFWPSQFLSYNEWKRASLSHSISV
jgi:hypothetical protein